MRPSRSFLLAIALSLAACGRDEILEQAETSGTSGRGSVEEPSSVGAVRASGDGGARGAVPASGVPASGVPASGVPGPAMGGEPGRAAPPSEGLAGAPAPGVPEPPKPGIPTEPAPGQPGQAQGPTVPITGTIVYGGYKGGDIKITAFDSDHSIRGGKPPRVVAMAVAKRPGPFTLLAPVGAGKLYVEAAIDEDGDGRPGPLDPQGQADRFPITVKDAPIDGVEIELGKREPPPRK
jgi:hypothetical protein